VNREALIESIVDSVDREPEGEITVRWSTVDGRRRVEVSQSSSWESSRMVDSETASTERRADEASWRVESTPLSDFGSTGRLGIDGLMAAVSKQVPGVGVDRVRTACLIASTLASEKRPISRRNLHRYGLKGSTEVLNAFSVALQGLFTPALLPEHTNQ